MTFNTAMETGNPNTYYRQCLLKEIESGKLTTCWVPEKLAKPNKLLCFKDQPSFETWKVMMVSDVRKPEDILHALQNQWKHWRKVTDI